MEPVKIPNRVGDPPHILIWSADELIPMLIGLTIGIVIGQALICTAIGFFITSLYRKYRDNNPDGYFLHAIYAWGFMPTKARAMKHPFVKRYYS